MAPFPSTEWRAQGFRLTAFPLPGSMPATLEWWRQAAGLEPDEQTTNPKKGSSITSGAFGPGKLILQVEPERVDWRLVPSDLDPANLPATFEVPVLGPLADVLQGFTELCDRWLMQAELPELGRLAFGAELVHPETGRAAGYEWLPHYLPVENKPDSSDFIYRINLPVPSRTGIDGLRINRVSTWTVAAYRLLGFQLVMGTGGSVVASPEAAYAFRSELDFNTAPGLSGPLPKGRLIDVRRELVALALEVAERGIRPL